jgi:hypothetical protein
LIGTPGDVRDGLQQYLDATGYGRVLLIMALPGLDTTLALRSMRLFMAEVAPALTPPRPRAHEQGAPASVRSGAAGS